MGCFQDSVARLRQNVALLESELHSAAAQLVQSQRVRTEWIAHASSARTL